MFVDTEISSSEGAPVLAVPEEAVLPTPDGDWEVFVERSPGEFRPVSVALLGSEGGLARIEGVEAGTIIVTAGAFFLQSELGKSGFDVDDD
jgi:multidrug efflux pump subunit AcrA (membrane-fusion protein)